MVIFGAALLSTSSAFGGLGYSATFVDVGYDFYTVAVTDDSCWYNDQECFGNIDAVSSVPYFSGDGQGPYLVY